MKYFGVLLRFVVIPLIVFRILIRRDRKNGSALPEALQSMPEETALLAHAAIAVAYTTPWDNYLVATNVWSYDPKLVTGYKIGYVPIEEYSFFVLQSLLTGSWLQYIARRLPADDQPYADNPTPRIAAAGGLSMLWLASTYRLIEGKNRNRYLSLILSWALLPLILQVGYGGDILWRHRKLLVAAIIPPTAYLGLTDSLAIGSGTWKINPEMTARYNVVKDLPFEELLFFFVTNVLLVFGMTLVQAKESENRLPPALQERYLKWKARWIMS